MSDYTEHLNLEKNDSGYNLDREDVNLEKLDTKTAKVIDEDPSNPDENEIWVNRNERKLKWVEDGVVRESPRDTCTCKDESTGWRSCKVYGSEWCYIAA